MKRRFLIFLTVSLLLALGKKVWDTTDGAMLALGNPIWNEK